MNNKALRFIKNFSYTLSSNFISLMISTILVLVVPKLIGVDDYGYWQLYLFYSSYVGFLHFGWNDGIYLRYGGKEYQDLNKPLFFSQFWMLFAFQVVVAAVIIVISLSFSADPNRLFIFAITALCMLLVNMRLMLLYILEGTNRIKELAQVTLMERIFYGLLIVLFLFLGFRDFQVLVTADIMGKFLSLSYAAYACREIVFQRLSVFIVNIKETLENISVGVKLMFANIASMFILGIVRFGIERSWDVATFGKVSLVLSVSALMMVFINALGTILFPILRRTDESRLPSMYVMMRTLVMVPILGLLIAYYPLAALLPLWLPQYTDGLVFMALLFPMSIYEGKMALLINTYLKTMRKEKWILLVNLASVGLSVLLTLAFTVFVKSLPLAIVSIVVLLAFRSIVAEWYLAKVLQVSVVKGIALETLMTVIFIAAGWYLSTWVGAGVYVAAFALYVLLQLKEMKFSFVQMKQLVRG